MNWPRIVASVTITFSVLSCGSDHSTAPSDPVLSYHIQLAPAQSVDVERESFSFVAAHVEFQTGVRVDGRQITWTIDDPSVAFFSVIRDTLVSVWGVKVGTTKLTAHSDTLSASITINVKPSVAASAVLSPAVLALEPGTERQLALTVMSTKKTEIRQNTVLWTSNDPSIAIVDAAGRVKAVAAGVVEISAKVDTVTARATVYIPTPFKGVTRGFDHGCALKPDGRVYCWGSNESGQLGDGTTTNRNYAVLVSTSVRFSSIHALANSTCGLTAEGTVYCWGSNFTGGTLVTQPTLVPSPVTFTQLAAGARHVCGITGDGSTYCWGAGFAAGAPAANGGGTVATPTRMVSAPPFASIASGDSFSCGLTADGSAHCWGLDFLGQLGDSVPEKTVTGRPTSAPVAGGYRFTGLRVGPRAAHICAIGTDSKAYCWGEYVESDAAPSTSNCLTVVPTQGGTGVSRCTAYPIPVSGTISFKDIAPATGGRCGLDQGGTPYCWGFMKEPSGLSVDRSSPIALATNLRFMSLTGGWYYYCGLTNSQAVYCWSTASYPSTFELLTAP